MIICNSSNIDIIQGVIGYGNTVEGITDWRLENTSSGIFNILNSSSIIRLSGGTSEIGEISGSTDRYMIFTAGTSTFTVPSGGINCDILMIGGGGGGSLAGGGAGACIVAVNQTLTANTYNVSVGTGGTGAVHATVGNDSSISVSGGTTRYLAKGGGPGGYSTQVVSGGCGGGGGYNTGANTHVGGTASTTNIVNGITGISPSVTSTYVVFGTNGGTATNNNNNIMAGGGGIGAVGGNYTGPALPAGSGGDGLFQATISGTVYNFRTYFANNTTFGVQDGTTGNYYIGGGGGGSAYWPVGTTPGNGGKGGGGKGGDVKTNLAAIAGTVNTGSGGGGNDSSLKLPYANGGSGIVIIRYSTANISIIHNGISIIDNGNVGIGTVPITSSSKLEIIGDVNISGNYRKNNRDIISDTSNYVLSTSNILSTNIENTRNRWTTNNNMIYYNTPNLLPDIITSSPNATTIGTTGNYRYMQFTYTTDNVSGLVGQTQYTINIPTGGIICDILIVGGGGGGGNAIHNSSHEPGGGGAGGVVYMVNKNLSAGAYKINVGNGGAGNTNGNNSSITDNNNNTLTFDNILLIGKGGGKGAAGHQTVGSDGGSGGGGGHDRANGGTGTQGNTFWNGTIYIAGGNNGAKPGGSSSGGGGGGAGEAGDTDGGGSGGDGVQVSITGINTFYAGGGNAYYNTSTTRSDGGGGTLNGTGSQQNGGSALPNTGSGGSGAYLTSSSTTGGSGGSGIVIIRIINLGNVGIGTTNPTSKLHLYDDTINETKLTIQNFNIINKIIPSPDANTSGIITNSTDRYMIFTSSSSFIIPTGGINCDIFMIGGGGEGSGCEGAEAGGGGGAGACIVAINQTLPNGNCIISIGNGGSGSRNTGNNGGLTSISVGGTVRYSAPGGGGGVRGPTLYGKNGGCGGGAGGTSYSGGNLSGGVTVDSTVVNVNGTIITSGPTNTPSSYAVFGNNGARFQHPSYDSPGGGGGIGAMGATYLYGGNGLYQATIGGNLYNFREYFANGNTSFGVNDGNGNYYFGGGGSGGGGVHSSFSGIGGLGGGGNGRTPYNSSATAGTPNTGGGGGAGGFYYGGSSSGGSGIVIIRYRSPSSTSSIELIRGTQNDFNRDYKIGNYIGDFIVKSSINGTDADYIKMTGTTGTITNPTGTTTWTTTSDRRIKENIERASYDKCYESINKLELNRFNYINGFNTVNRDITQLGFIAQEVKEIFPKSVFENSYVNNNINISDLQSIDTTQINYTLYGAVKKLIEKVNNNVKRIKYLKNILNLDIDTTSTSNITSNLIMN